MAIPTYDQFIEPLLRLLARQSEPVSVAQAADAVAAAVGLSEEDKR